MLRVFVQQQKSLACCLCPAKLLLCFFVMYNMAILGLLFAWCILLYYHVIVVCFVFWACVSGVCVFFFFPVVQCVSGLLVLVLACSGVTCQGGAGRLRVSPVAQVHTGVETHTIAKKICFQLQTLIKRVGNNGTPGPVSHCIAVCA